MLGRGKRFFPISAWKFVFRRCTLIATGLTWLRNSLVTLGLSLQIFKASSESGAGLFPCQEDKILLCSLECKLSLKCLLTEPLRMNLRAHSAPSLSFTQRSFTRHATNLIIVSAMTQGNQDMTTCSQSIIRTSRQIKTCTGSLQA